MTEEEGPLSLVELIKDEAWLASYCLGNLRFGRQQRHELPVGSEYRVIRGMVLQQKILEVKEYGILCDLRIGTSSIFSV